MTTSNARRLRNARWIATLGVILALPAVAETVTYNGSLTDGGKPANGAFDLRVQLYTAPTGGVPVGEAITLSGVRVENGRFSTPVELAQPLPRQGSLWLQAQLQAPDGGGFQPLQGRQEISATLGGVCWETSGNTAAPSGILGIIDGSSTLLTIRNDTNFMYLRRGGGLEQGNSQADGASSAAFGDTAGAAATNSFAAGRGNVAAGHTFTTVFGDGQTGSFTSTAANQFLVRAQNGVGINTASPLGTLSVRRGGTSGVTAAAASSIVTDSDASNYISILSPSTQERGLLFGNPGSVANGGILFNPIGSGIENPSGLTFRTGGNLDRMKLTSGGQLLLNTQTAGVSDVTVRDSADIDSDLTMELHSSSDKTGLLFVNDTSGDFLVKANDGNLVLLTNSASTAVRTQSRFGVSRTPSANALEVNGDASKSTAGAWLANSDRRIKQDIQPVDHALQTLRQVQPVSFEYTQAYRAAHPGIADQRYFNVVAQDFARVFPDAVQGSGEYLPGAARTKANEILQVDTYPATITAIAAIQELDAANTVRDREVAALKQENAALRQRLDALDHLLRSQR